MKDVLKIDLDESDLMFNKSDLSKNKYNHNLMAESMSKFDLTFMNSRGTSPTRANSSI